MAKKLIILTIAIFYLSASAGFTSAYLGFLFNRNFIAEQLCEKKEIKNNSCQGNCHIKKELKKAAEKKSSPVSVLFSKDKYEILFEITVIDNSEILSKKQYLLLCIKEKTDNHFTPEVPPPQYPFC